MAKRQWTGLHNWIGMRRERPNRRKDGRGGGDEGSRRSRRENPVPKGKANMTSTATGTLAPGALPYLKHPIEGYAVACQVQLQKGAHGGQRAEGSGGREAGAQETPQSPT